MRQSLQQSEKYKDDEQEKKGTKRVSKIKNSPIKLDLEMQKEIAKIGMVASLGVVTLTAFMMKNKTAKNIHIGSGIALIGFSFWHQMLYVPKKPNKKQIKKQVPQP